MNLNVNEWKEFKIGKLFKIENGKKYPSDVRESGDLPLVSTSAENNGVSDYIATRSDHVYSNFLTVAYSGSVGATFYHGQEVFVGETVFALLPLFEMTMPIGMFIATIMNFENYRYSYGRKIVGSKYVDATIKLPILKDKDGLAVIDSSYQYNEHGYIPDWEFMESYIKSLHYKPLSTTISKEPEKTILNTAKWHEFYLKDLFVCKMGNGIDASATTEDNPKYNYVSRNSNNNGVVAQVDEIDGEKPFPEGTLSLALGGSYLGSCFIQHKPYYTAQNVAVLEPKEDISDSAKLFITTLIRNECKYKYVAFGRELNKHFRTDFTIKLPIKYNDDGYPLIDENCLYSDMGYVPDFDWMDWYIKQLPYSDKL